jgi:hypothetical protein
MVEAVIASYDLTGRQVYLSPHLEPPAGMMEQQGFEGRIRHAAETLKQAEERYGARIMTPLEAVHCPERDRPDKCTIPGNGILFDFMLPRPLQQGTLPVRIMVYHHGRGQGGQILREAWDFVLTREPQTGWRVVRKVLVATGQGPGQLRY